MFCAAYSNTQPWIDDPSLIPQPWGLNLAYPRAFSHERKLRIGVLRNDGVLQPSPAVVQTLDAFVNKLKGNSIFDISEFAPLNHDNAWSIIAANYLEDAGTRIKKLCAEGGEPVLPLVEWLIGETEKWQATVSSNPQERKIARDAFRVAYSDHWNAQDVDVVLAPVTPSTAQAPGTSIYWGYSAIWNLVDYPALAFPASKVLGQDLGILEWSDGVSEIEKAYQQHYDPVKGSLLPIGLQIVAKRLRESDLLAAMTAISEALG